MSKRSVLSILILLCSTILFAQKYTISGYVKDAKSGEAISGVNVYFVDINKGTATNTYGYYSITVESGEYLFKIQAVGYRSFQENINLNKSIRKDIELTPIVYTKQEVVVSATRSDDNVRAAAMGTQVVNVEALKKMPSFFGEVDVIKTVQLMPGVQSAGEGSSGYHVRGGGLDQNLVLLDEAIIYNTGHLFGFFSIFNTDAIRSAEMIKSGMAARGQYEKISGGRGHRLDICPLDSPRTYSERQGFVFGVGSPNLYRCPYSTVFEKRFPFKGFEILFL